MTRAVPQGVTEAKAQQLVVEIGLERSKGPPRPNKLRKSRVGKYGDALQKQLLILSDFSPNYRIYNYNGFIVHQPISMHTKLLSPELARKHQAFLEKTVNPELSIQEDSKGLHHNTLENHPLSNQLRMVPGKFAVSAIKARHLKLLFPRITKKKSTKLETLQNKDRTRME